MFITITETEIKIPRRNLPGIIIIALVAVFGLCSLRIRLPHPGYHMTYVITSNLNQESNESPMFAEIKKFGSWAKISNSSYAVKTDLSAQEVFEKLKNHIGSNDGIYVIPIIKPPAGSGPKDVNDWLVGNLTD